MLESTIIYMYLLYIAVHRSSYSKYTHHRYKPSFELIFEREREKKGVREREKEKEKIKRKTECEKERDIERCHFTL